MPSATSFLAALAGLSVLAAAPLAAQDVFSEADLDQNGRRAAPRDAFPVLNDPAMAGVAEADQELRDDEPVIGVVLGGEAKAYPVAVMGSHELVNDHCGRIPIAASW